MSWAELKKFLNKRPDKALDEIIVDESLKNRIYASHVANISVAEKDSTYGTGYDVTAVKIEGKGRIVAFDVSAYVPQTGTATVEIIVDGQEIASYTLDDTGTKTGSSYNTHLLKVQGVNPSKLFSKYNASYHMTILCENGFESMLQSVNDNYPADFYNGVKITKTKSQASGQYYYMIFPEDLEFSESFEIQINNIATNKTLSGFVLYSLDD